MEKQCPRCGLTNDDDWPLETNEKIAWGGCQGCWEKECEQMWWEQMNRIIDAYSEGEPC